MSVELKLSRSNRIFRPDEPLEGKIITKLRKPISHNAIRLTLNGSVTLQVRGGSAGVIESLYGVLKPIPILNKIVDIRSSGRLDAGVTEVGHQVTVCGRKRNLHRSNPKFSSCNSAITCLLIPFSVILKDKEDKNSEKFYETFHGADISIQYLLTVDILRGYLHKSLSTTMEFIIESEKANLPDPPLPPEKIIFYITQDTQRHSLLPELRSGGFRVTGRICTQCSLTDPISGELTVEASAVPIHSIDIHLLRVEKILLGDRIINEASLVQTTQIADGDICRNMSLPIYIILPRLLTCPTIYAGPFSIEFKLTIVITFQSELLKLHQKFDPKTPRLWLAMESVPLELVRTK